MPLLGMVGQGVEGVYYYLMQNNSCDFQCLFITRSINDIVWGYNDSVLDYFGLRFPGTWLPSWRVPDAVQSAVVQAID
jgi:hypothetical protein